MRRKLVIFSGAGMSAESGISTFRDSGGLWEKYKIEDVATPEAWQKNPDLVSDFYNQRRKQIIETEPNEAHRIITQLEKSHEVIIITQNIDDLHERAGSTNVLHLHGNIRFSKSSGPNQEKEYYPIDGWKLDSDDVCPNGYRLRPHVVWFGEDVPMYEKAVKEIEMADVFIVTGTSLQVYPAAGLIHYASRNAVKWIIDPNVNAFSVPNTFQKINKNASEGMTDLLNILIN
ncbi:MAG: SIR2 family NAD-dependent protein deacylase [Crocinitomicaceae bacterium]|jgi:NAD-dependent deacetylase